MTLCSTDDRYADDVHYRGGCVLALDMLHWASSMLTWNARPPDPRRLRRGLARGLARAPGGHARPAIEHWLGHQRRDAYWKHGSVCEDYAAIECPVYAVGGFADGYTNAVPRLLAGLSVPRKGLIGPWAHAFPDDALPGPAIGFLQECVRWLDHWLKGIDTGVMDEPMLRVWMQDSVAPRPSYDGAAGALGRRAVVAVAPRRDRRVWELPARASRASSSASSRRGREAGVWTAEGQSADLAGDQRPDDALSLAFDSEPLAGAAGDPRASRRRARAGRRPAERARRRAALRRLPGRHVGARHARAPQPHAPREPRAAGAARAGPRYEVRVPLDVMAYSLPRRPPPAASPSRRRTGPGPGRRPSRSR